MTGAFHGRVASRVADDTRGRISQLRQAAKAAREGTWRRPSEDEVPQSQLSLRYTYHDLDPVKVKAILGDNGCRVWGLNFDKLHGLAQTINAPTLREVLTPIETVPEEHSMWTFRQLGAFG